MKVEDSTADKLSSNAGSHDGLATPRGSDDSSARTRAVDGLVPRRGSDTSSARARPFKNASGKNKRRRSNADSKEKVRGVRLRCFRFFSMKQRRKKYRKPSLSLGVGGGWPIG